nr:MAK10-like protein [Tanacetum cinerariifolium]
MRAIKTPLRSPMGIMWCLCDPTPFDWCKTYALSTEFSPDSLDLDVADRKRTTAKLQNDILMFQQHQVQIFYDHVNSATRRTIDQSARGKLCDKNAKESWALLEDLALYEKVISLPQDVPSTSDHHLIKLENKVQCLMEAHLAPKSSIQVNKIASSCEICYMNTIELPEGNNVVPLRSDNIQLVQNRCSFHRLRFEDPNQHLKDFLKLVDSLDLNGENKERMHLCLFQFSHRDQASNWLEVFQRTIDQSARGKLCDKNAKESWALLEDLALYEKVISLPQDVPSTSDHHLIKLENKVQCLMEAHLAPKSSIQVNKIASSCEICGGRYDTQYCMENPEQDFVDYASSRTEDAEGK